MASHPFYHDLFHWDNAPTNTGKAPSYLRDHRKRLRQRFLEGGADAMPDYELLELILFRAIPRQDVKPLARRLLDTFGSYNAVISAPISKLNNVKGVGDTVAEELKIVEAAAQRLVRTKLLDKPVITSWSALLDYCHASLSNLEAEEFHVLFLNQRNILIADEVQGQGTVNHAPVYPREIVRRALDLNASALILVHNHPSGDPTPSADDIEITHKIETAAGALGIKLHDHIIIGKSCEISFRTAGLI